MRLSPYFTVSQSEDGLEKVMQSVTLTLAWEIQSGSRDITVVLDVSAGEQASAG